MDFKIDVNACRQQIIDKKVNRDVIVNGIYDMDSFRDVAITSKFYLPSQSYGAVIEQWFRNEFDWDKISASDTAGDSRAFEEYNVEVKASLCADGIYCHYVQLRLTHDVDYYFLPTYDFLTDTTYFFLLSHDAIVDLVETGQTLKENGLKEIELIHKISSMLIVNKSSYKINRKKIDNFVNLMNTAR